MGMSITKMQPDIKALEKLCQESGFEAVLAECDKYIDRLQTSIADSRDCPSMIGRRSAIRAQEKRLILHEWYRLRDAIREYVGLPKITDEFRD